MLSNKTENYVLLFGFFGLRIILIAEFEVTTSTRIGLKDT